MLSGIHALFNHPGLRSFLVKMRVPLVLVAAAAVIWAMDPRWLWPALAVSMLGELIQLWCFASLNKNEELACRGPYAVVRNPMYLGRFFIILGALCLLGRWWVLPLFALVYYLYMVNRVKREEALLREVFGEKYAAYCAAVRRFVPSPRYRGEPLLYWRWELLWQNHGPRNLIGTAVFWVAAIAWAYLRSS